MTTATNVTKDTTIERIPFDTLGGADHGWLRARHHFSFANYYDPSRTGIGPLLVWNDDEVQGGTGFPMHPHRDMEIITYVREGAITHGDHLGNSGRTEAGDVQVMSAGSGIMHSEKNNEDGPSTLFQIWIQPHTTGVTPRWEQRRFPKDARDGRFIALASGRQADIDNGALLIHQDAAVLGATLAAGQTTDYRIGANRVGYLVVSKGKVTVDGVDLFLRDGAAIRNTDMLSITADEPAELVLADLPA